jgi:hypothetical protein
MFKQLIREKFLDSPDDIYFKHMDVGYINIITKNPWNYKHRR